MSGPRGEFARIEERVYADGVAVHLGVQSDAGRLLFGPGGQGPGAIFAPHSEFGQMPEEYAPALTVSDSMARELLRALSAHYGTADIDSRQLRADYVQERARVDKLTDAVIVIADRVTDASRG